MKKFLGEARTDNGRRITMPILVEVVQRLKDSYH